MKDGKLETEVLRERDAGREKELRGNARQRTPGQEDSPQFPGGEYPANDQPLPGKHEAREPGDDTRPADPTPTDH